MKLIPVPVDDYIALKNSFHHFGPSMWNVTKRTEE